ncbi:type II toxin-antitoxin system VapC family toxin [Burkholderia sp. Bp8992]|nr:type II toxin-antitoxin system VapC family toxin [Burkholderia sp. Bp8992]
MAIDCFLVGMNRAAVPAGDRSPISRRTAQACGRHYGAYKSQRAAANVARVEALQFEVVTFDVEDAQHAGEIRAYLTAAGTPIGPYDALIAGQARARQLVLVTHNVREFERVPRLQVEDWLVEPNEG